MEKIKEICEQLQMTSGKKDKEQILHQNKDNGLLQDVLQFVFNPFILTGLSDKKINKNVSVKNTYEIEDIFHAMQYLKEKNTGTDEVIANIQYFLNNECEDMRDFYKQIFTKSLKLGCDTKTFNKVWGKNFIDEWEVQQAYSVDKYKLKTDEWFSLSHKLNGNRASYYDGKLISRQGQAFKGLQHIISDIEELNLTDMFIDGELVRKNIDNVSDGENFRIGTGIINSDTARLAIAI